MTYIIKEKIMSNGHDIAKDHICNEHSSLISTVSSLKTSLEFIEKEISSIATDVREIKLSITNLKVKTYTIAGIAGTIGTAIGFFIKWILQHAK